MASRRSHEAVWRTQRRRQLDVAVTLVPELDATGQLLGATKFVRDITQRKQQEAALQMSQEFLARAGSLAGVGGWAVGLLAKKLHGSDEVCRIHGVAPGPDPTLDQALAFCAPDSQPVFTAAVEQAVATGSMFDLELQIIRADGALRWVRTVGAADMVAGQPVRLAGACQDITARVEANRRLAESEARFRVLSDAAPFAVDGASCCDRPERHMPQWLERADLTRCDVMPAPKLACLLCLLGPVPSTTVLRQPNPAGRRELSSRPRCTA